MKFTEEDVSEFILMGKSLGRALDKYSLFAFYKKFKKDPEKNKQCIGEEESLTNFFNSCAFLQSAIGQKADISL